MPSAEGVEVSAVYIEHRAPSQARNVCFPAVLAVGNVGQPTLFKKRTRLVVAGYQAQSKQLNSF